MTEQNALARRIFDGLSVSYDSVVERMTLYQDRTWKRRMLRGLGLRRGMRVLDVGCGTCLLEEMPEFSASDVVGVDITGGMLRLAQAKRLPSVSMLGVADAEHLPFEEGSFDLVVSCYVPKYCDTERFVEELCRVLKPGGRMAVYDFTRPHGPFAPLLRFYVYGFIPVLGRLASLVDPSLGYTCRVLPGLVRTATWSEEIDGALEKNKVSKQGEEEMAAGVVTVFWASKD